MRAAAILTGALVVATVACSSDDPAPADADPSVTTSIAGEPDAETSPENETAAETDDGVTATAPDLDATQPKPEAARTAGDVDAPAGVEPDGFSTVTVAVTSDDGDVCEVCLWLADSGPLRNRGLMGVTDLGGPVGMLFRFSSTTSGNFFMFGTPMPLSIAWFADDGEHVGQTDMSPCLVDDSAECERYGPGAEYLFAIEMVQGELDTIGIEPGSSIEVLATHDTCPAVS